MARTRITNVYAYVGVNEAGDESIPVISLSRNGQPAISVPLISAERDHVRALRPELDAMRAATGQPKRVWLCRFRLVASEKVEILAERQN